MRSTELVFLISWLLAAGYAAFDEFHQSFTAERTPLFQDVILDSVGALTGILIVYLFVRLRKNRKRK